MLTISQADDIIAAARDRAQALSVAVNIAVLDSGGHLKSFCRMDGAVLGSIDLALPRRARPCCSNARVRRSGIIAGPVPPHPLWNRAMAGLRHLPAAYRLLHP